MQNTFESIISNFLDTKVGLSDIFLSKPLASQLKKNLLSLYLNRQLKASSIGNKTKLLTDRLIRSDVIYWLDRSHNNKHENRFFDLMDKFIIYLNRTCYTGITSYEFHYALYEKGSSYKRHLDQFTDNKSRAFTMIMYLNEDWKENDGGKLLIYHPNHEQSINPTNGSCVFFKSSELEHEVLTCYQPRFSITGWLKTTERG